ncbi:hypothetical protein OsJ_21050 [Oryza sativa Japonica Group]|uniref:Uncharacterized protein n=1 Tax=Oryza sativa subsp. japonica TaxID=39947 RepID=A3BAX5_ORYSJ|nr:hypothetical protein OsJ_21050 [Oryza sativa Japonica Group]
MIAAIRATTAVLKATSPTTPMASPPLAPTKCLTECPNNNITWVAANSNHIGEMLAPTAAWELGDRKDMDQAPYIATKDLPKVTPTKCSTLCSSFDNKPDLTVAVVVTCATSVKSLMELVATDSTTSGTHIDTPDSTKAMPTNCLMFGMMVNTGTIQTGVVFPLFLDKLDIVTVLTLHWAGLKPWPPPHEDDLTYILVNQREVELWRTILVDHNKEGLLMIIELYVLDLNDCCLSWSHLILASVLVVELSSTRQCGYEIISFKSNHVDKLKLFGMSINVLEQCEHLEGDLIRLIIKEKLMPWNSGMGICLCCLLVIQLPVGKLKWNVSVISLFHLLITKVNEFPRGITTGGKSTLWTSSECTCVGLHRRYPVLLPFWISRAEKWVMRHIGMTILVPESWQQASYKVLYGAEKLLNLNAEDKSYTRVKSFEEGASSVQYKPNKAQLERQQSSTNKVLGSHRTEQASAASATAAAAS